MRSQAKENRDRLVVYLMGFGVRKSAKAIVFVMGWSMCWDDLGHEPTPIEYCAWAGVAQSTYYRELALFREVFPMFEYPTELAALAVAKLRSRDRWVDLRVSDLPGLA